jgi:hypothetical protein
MQFNEGKKEHEQEGERAGISFSKVIVLSIRIVIISVLVN